MRIAKFKVHVTDTCSYERIVPEPHAPYQGPENVRISEWVDVEFPPRAPEEIVPEQLAVLDKAEEELRAKFQVKLTEIAEQRAKLKALTWDGQP